MSKRRAGDGGGAAPSKRAAAAEKPATESGGLGGDEDDDAGFALPPYAIELDRQFYAFMAVCALFYSRDHIVCTWTRIQKPFIGLVGKPITAEVLRHCKFLAGDAFNVGHVVVPRDPIAASVNTLEPTSVTGLQQDIAIYLSGNANARQPSCVSLLTALCIVLTKPLARSRAGVQSPLMSSLVWRPLRLT